MTANVKGSRNTIRNVLTLKESLALDKILRERYTTSGLDNVAFAMSINDSEQERSKFRADITKTHIATGLEAAEILPNRIHRSPQDSIGDALGLVARVQELEERVTKLCEYIRQFGPPPK